MLNNNNNKGERIRVRRRSRKAQARKRRNRVLLFILSLTSVSAIAAMFSNTPAGYHVARVVKERLADMFEAPAAPTIAAPALARGKPVDDDPKLALVPPAASPSLTVSRDMYPEGDSKNWDIETYLTLKRPPEEGSAGQPLSAERDGLFNDSPILIDRTPLWDAVAPGIRPARMLGRNGGTGDSSVVMLSPERGIAAFNMPGAATGNRLAVNANPADTLDVLTLQAMQSPGLDNQGSVFVPVTPRPQSSQPDRTAAARQNVTPPPLVAMVDFKDVAPNSEPLISATDSDVTPEPAAQSIEVSEPARLALFGCAGIYLFVLRRALTARRRKASA